MNTYARLLFLRLLSGLSVLIVLGFLWVLYEELFQTFSNDAARMQQSQLEKRVEGFDAFISRSRNILLYLSESSIVGQYGVDGSHKKELERLFLTIANTVPEVMQVRFIATGGVEKIRVEKTSSRSQAFVTTPDALQDKSHRPYFRHALEAPAGMIRVSSLDLNREHGIIETPHKPTIRLSAPVYEKGVVQGVIVINLFMQSVIDTMVDSHRYDFYLVQNDGKFVLHPDPRHNWSNVLTKNDQVTLYDEFGEYADEILSEKHFESKNILSRRLHRKSEATPQLTLIATPKEDFFQVYNLNTMMVLTPVLIIAVLIFMLATSIYLIRKVKRLNLTLKSKVDEQVAEIRSKDDELLQQSRLIVMGEMISMLAHQWRQPLATIGMALNNIELNLMESDQGEKNRTYIDQINRQVRALSRIIDDFRRFYKPDKEKSWFSVDDVLDDCRGVINSTLESSGIELDIQVEEGVYLFAYQGALQRTIVNLLANAQDAIKRNEITSPRIDVSARREGDEVLITVCDNGGGIDEEHLPKIMEPYFTTKGSNGTGLGLYICKNLVEKHLNGRLMAYNAAGGACFDIRIPTES